MSSVSTKKHRHQHLGKHLKCYKVESTGKIERVQSLSKPIKSFLKSKEKLCGETDSVAVDCFMTGKGNKSDCQSDNSCCYYY